MKKNFTRLRLEALEGRCCPTDLTWSGNGAVAAWNDGRNWGGAFISDPTPSTPSDTATFPANVQPGVINVPSSVTELKGLTVNLGTNVDLKLQHSLQLDGVFGLNSGTIEGANGAGSGDVTLHAPTPPAMASFIWNGGTLGSSTVGTKLTLTNAATLTMGGSSPAIYGNILIGTGGTDSGNNLDFQAATLTLKGGAYITAQVNSQLTIDSGSQSVIQDDSTANNASDVGVLGKMIVGCQTTEQVGSQCVPIDVAAGGQLSVQSHNTLTVKNGTSSSLTYGVRTRGTPSLPSSLRLGEINSSDTVRGQSILECDQLGANVGQYSYMYVWGQGNAVWTVGGAGDAKNLSIDGWLIMSDHQLGQSGWNLSVLRVTNGDLDFHSTSTFSSSVTTVGGLQSSVVTVTGGNINSQLGAIISVTADPDGTYTNGLTWSPVLSVTTGAFGGDGFHNSADGKWATYYNPAGTIMGLKYIGS
jgi:hypothetical protein